MCIMRYNIIMLVVILIFISIYAIIEYRGYKKYKRILELYAEMHNNFTYHLRTDIKPFFNGISEYVPEVKRITATLFIIEGKRFELTLNLSYKLPLTEINSNYILKCVNADCIINAIYSTKDTNPVALKFSNMQVHIIEYLDKFYKVMTLFYNRQYNEFAEEADKFLNSIWR